MHQFGKFFKKNIKESVHVYVYIKFIRTVTVGPITTLPIHRVWKNYNITHEVPAHRGTAYFTGGRAALFAHTPPSSQSGQVYNAGEDRPQPRGQIRHPCFCIKFYWNKADFLCTVYSCFCTPNGRVE